MDASPLAGWESFYVIVGSSAGALTGLQFVAMTLIVDSGIRGTAATVDAFGTPTLIHFIAVLLVAAIASAPWPGLTGPAVVLAILGAAGIVYSILTVRRAHRQKGYKPVLEDWLWHGVFPIVSYVIIAGAAAAVMTRTVPALFAIAGASVVLVLIGVHNAWDTVTYVALQQHQDTDSASRP